MTDRSNLSPIGQALHDLDGCAETLSLVLYHPPAEEMRDRRENVLHYLAARLHEHADKLNDLAGE
jgi:hypothetical protein